MPSILSSCTAFLLTLWFTEYANTDKPVGVIRSSYREDGKIRHKQFGRITGQTLEQLKMLQLTFRNEVIAKSDPKAVQIVGSKEYGASYAILSMIKEIGLDKAMYSQPQPWVSNISAMIIGRIIFAGSKLALWVHKKITSHT